MDNSGLKKVAQKIRCHILRITTAVASGHPGGSLSCADILTVLYFDEMRVDPKQPKWPERDRFVLSKGHASPALYAALAEKGFFPVSRLGTFRRVGGLQGHPHHDVPGVDISTGSLGQGLAAANGMALAGKIDRKDYRVYAIIGDGESQEGEIWEAAMLASKYKLDNLVTFLDRNLLQIDGSTENVMPLEPLAAKWKAFGWHVIEIDGHDFDQIKKALAEAKATKGKPTLILARTTKGKGVSFMEGQAKYHGTPIKPEELPKALEEICAA